MFQDRTRYSPQDMELTQGVPDRSEPETPKRPGIFRRREPRPTTVRRNLMNAFDNSDTEDTIQLEEDSACIPQPVDVSTLAKRVPNSFVREESSDSKWSVLILTWSVVFIVGAACSSALYTYFPGFFFYFCILQGSSSFLKHYQCCVLC